MTELKAEGLVLAHESNGFFESRWATFSDDRLYRYQLGVTWKSGAGQLNFLMLNPSTADEFKNDPTVERCCRRARQMGFGSLVVTNIFAWRSTDPFALYELPEPVGVRNDQAILHTARFSKLVICGWGNHGKLQNRGPAVLELLKSAGHKPHFLRLTKDGNPEHPLYIPYSAQPKPL